MPSRLISKITIAAVVVYVVGVSIPPLPTHAQNNNDIKDPTGLIDSIRSVEKNIADPDKALAKPQSAFYIIQTILLWILGLAAIAALVALIIGGVMFILSVGNEDRARTAKRIILYAIVGLLIIGTSFLIVQTVGTIFTK